MEQLLLDGLKEFIQSGDLEQANNHIQYLFRQIVRTDPNVSNLMGITLDDQIETARIDRFNRITISPDFILKYLNVANDFRFLLQHEHAHKVIQFFIATTGANPYLAYIERRGLLGFLEDAIINLSLIHACPSDLPERYYTTIDMTILLQRHPKAKKEFGETISDSKAKLALSQLLANEQRYIKTRELPALGNVAKRLCEFLLLLNLNGNSFKDLVENSHAETCEDLKDVLESHDPVGGSSNSRTSYDIAIPLGKGVTLRDVEYVLPQLAHQYLELDMIRVNVMQAIEKAILTSETGRPYRSYSNPSYTDIAKLAYRIVTPWTNLYTAPPNRILYFDVSGSILKYLSLAADIFISLRDQINYYYAFSGIIKPLIMTDSVIKTQTNYNTRLDSILNHLSESFGEGGFEVFILSDGLFYCPMLSPAKVDMLNSKYTFYLLKVKAGRSIWPDGLNKQEVIVY